MQGRSRSIAINPNGADAYVQLGIIFSSRGEPEEGMKFIKKAIRLNPIPPALYFNFLGYAYYSLGRYEDAIEVLRKVLKRSPNNQFTHIYLAAVLNASGQDEEARQQVKRLLELDPAFSLEEFAKTINLDNEAEVDRFVADLRKAGLK